VHRGQAEPGPLPDPLGGVVGIEDALLDVGGDTRARVPEGQADEARRLLLPFPGSGRGRRLHLVEADREGPPRLSHGMQGVRSQIQEDLADLRRVRDHTTEVLRDLLVHLDVGRERLPEHADPFLDEAPEVDDLGFDLVLPAEGQDLPGQALGTAGSLDDRSQARFLLWLSGVLRQGELRVPEEDSEDVVEVVGDTGGEPPDGRELGALMDALLELGGADVLGNVSDRDDDALLVPDLRRLEVELDPPLLVLSSLDEGPQASRVPGRDARDMVEEGAVAVRS